MLTVSDKYNGDRDEFIHLHNENLKEKVPNGCFYEKLVFYFKKCRENDSITNNYNKLMRCQDALTVRSITKDTREIEEEIDSIKIKANKNEIIADLVLNSPQIRISMGNYITCKSKELTRKRGKKFIPVVLMLLCEFYRDYAKLFYEEIGLKFAEDTYLDISNTNIDSKTKNDTDDAMSTVSNEEIVVLKNAVNEYFSDTKLVNLEVILGQSPNESQSIIPFFSCTKKDASVKKHNRNYQIGAFFERIQLDFKSTGLKLISGDQSRINNERAGNYELNYHPRNIERTHVELSIEHKTPNKALNGELLDSENGAIFHAELFEGETSGSFTMQQIIDKSNLNVHGIDEYVSGDQRPHIDQMIREIFKDLIVDLLCSKITKEKISLNDNSNNEGNHD